MNQQIVLRSFTVCVGDLNNSTELVYQRKIVFLFCHFIIHDNYLPFTPTFLEYMYTYMK